MSQISEPDSEVVDLSLSFGGLSISIRGSPDRAAAFVRDLASSSHSTGPAQPGLPSGPSLAASSTAYSLVSSQPIPAPPINESRSSIRESFPAVPGYWLEIAGELTGSRLSGAQRIQRAWTAGCWAGAVKQQRIGTPDRTIAIELSNRFYVVIQCRGLDCPRVFSTYRAFNRAAGQLSGTNTICHGFPTDFEARVFLEAAGEEYPLRLD